MPANQKPAESPARPWREIDEEIETMQKLVDNSASFMKNKNFTPSHREECRKENKIFNRILTRLHEAEALLKGRD